MKSLILLLVLMCLTGCSRSDTAPQKTPVPEQPPAQTQTSELYLYTNDNRYLAIDAAGIPIMEVTDGQMAILRQDGQPAGIAVQRADGIVTDEWGWVQPEKTWCDIYDTTGVFRFSLPLNYVNLSGNLIFGYNSEKNTSQIYSWLDGTLLYDDIYSNYDLGEYTYVNFSAWDAPGIFLDFNGREVGRVPEEYTTNGSVLDQYITVMRDGFSGVIAPDGQLLLPCRYERIKSGHMGCVYAKDSDGWHAIALKSGNTLFSWPEEIHILMPHSAIVATGENTGLYQLISLDGTLLLAQELFWPTSYDADKDDVPDLLNAANSSDDSVILFQPDGTVIRQSMQNGYFTVLSSDRVLVNEYLSDEAGTINGSRWSILNPETGTQTPLSSGSDAYCNPIYTETGIEPGILTRSGSNALGWYRTDIIDYDGNVILAALQDAAYRGNGVFQCSVGFTSGLMRSDGTWLYEESSFSDMTDD